MRKMYSKQYVGNTVTSFRFRFNNYKCSLNRFSKGQRDLCGQHLCEHFLEESYSGLKDFKAQIIDYVFIYLLKFNKIYYLFN